MVETQEARIDAAKDIAQEEEKKEKDRKKKEQKKWGNQTRCLSTRFYRPRWTKVTTALRWILLFEDYNPFQLVKLEELSDE